MDETTLWRVINIIHQRLEAAEKVKEKYDPDQVEYRKAADRHAELRGVRSDIAYEFFGKVDWEYVERDTDFMERTTELQEE